MIHEKLDVFVLPKSEQCFRLAVNLFSSRLRQDILDVEVNLGQ